MARQYTDELKAQVIAEWLAGASLDSLAAAYRMPKSTVQNWMDGRTRMPVVPKPKSPVLDEDNLDDLAWHWATSGFRATAAILRKVEDDSWLSGQNAHDLGVLYGIIADKHLRLLAAFKPLIEGGNSVVNSDANA